MSTVLVAHDQHSHEKKSNPNKVDFMVGHLLKVDLKGKVENDFKAPEDVGHRWADIPETQRIESISPILKL